MYELIFYGRGGQGGVTASKIFAQSAVLSESFPECSAFPAFGTERRGAPVAAYCRISDTRIRRRSHVKQADIMVILDHLLLDQSKIDQLKDNSILIVNTSKTPEEIYQKYNFDGKNVKIVTVDLIKISHDLNLLNNENQPIVNTSILGPLVKVVDGIELDHLEKAIKSTFGSNSISEKNYNAAKIAAEQIHIAEFKGGDN